MFLLYVDYFDMWIKWVGHFFQMVDLHSNSNFLISFYMIHPRDVIKISCKEVGQKAESNLFSKLEKVFHFSDSFSANYHKNECFVCNGFSKTLSDSQEITHKSKSLVQPFLKSSREKDSKIFTD